MSTLIEISREMQDIFEQLAESGGELTPELENQLSLSKEALILKLDGYESIMKRLSNDEAHWRDLASRYTNVARGCKNTAEFMKKRIKYVMNEMSVSTISGDNVKFSLSKSKSKLVINQDKIGNEWKMQVSEWVPDKERIKAALEDGQEIPGAYLEPIETLRVSVAKK